MVSIMRGGASRNGGVDHRRTETEYNPRVFSSTVSKHTDQQPESLHKVVQSPQMQAAVGLRYVHTLTSHSLLSVYVGRLALSGPRVDNLPSSQASMYGVPVTAMGAVCRGAEEGASRRTLYKTARQCKKSSEAQLGLDS